MSKVQMLRAFVNQRLSAAAEEIFGLFERTIAEHEEELCRSKEENERQRKLLDAVFQPEVRLHRAGVQQLSVRTEEVPPEQQEWSPSLDQDPEPPHIKEEQEELWTSQEGEQLRGLEEADITEFTFAPVKSEEDDDEEKPQSSQLHQSQTEENRDAELLKTEADGEDCGGPEPARNFNPDNPLQPDIIKTSHSSESETEDSDGDNWKDTREPESELNTLNSNEVVLNDMGCNSAAKSYSCSECGRIFDQRGTLQRHVRRHTGEKPFSCSDCGKNFTQSGPLVLHLRVHTGEKPFTCSVCNASFSQKGALEQHTRIHTGEKPFICSICGKQLTRYHHLIGHMRCHSGEKPFSCSVCNKQFRWSGDVASHMRIHTGEKPHGCSVCGRRFTQRSSLFTHSKSHNEERPLSCLVCNRRFHLKTTLVNHMRTHTGEKPYNCTVCGKGFSQIGAMNRHTRIHTGEKPFSCNVCGKRFRQQTHVRSHKCVVQSSSST